MDKVITRELLNAYHQGSLAPLLDTLKNLRRIQVTLKDAHGEDQLYEILGRLAPGGYDNAGNQVLTWDQLMTEGELEIDAGVLRPTSTRIETNSYFYLDKDVNKIVISNEVVEIGSGAFRGARSESSVTWGHFNSIVIPEGVERIASGAFSEAALVGTIYFPNSLKSIGTYAFGFCLTLEEVYIPAGVTSIASDAFAQDRDITKIHYSGTATGAPWGATNATIVP